MKRKALLALAAASLMALASCDTKPCYCYDYTTTGAVPNTVYTESSSPCSTLNRGTDGNYGSRVCTEANERQPDPGSVASKRNNNATR